MASQTIVSTEDHDEIIAKLTILSDKRYLRTVTDMVTDISKTQDLNQRDAKKLDQVIEDIFTTVVDDGYGGDNTKEIYIIVSKRAHSLVVAIEDKGLPFDYEKLERGEDKRFTKYLAKGYADHVYFKSLGKRGNRTEIIKDLPAQDIRNEMNLSEHEEHVAQDKAPIEEDLEVKMMRIDDVKKLVRIVYKCYGYTYANEFMYYPEQVEARIKSGMMKSFATYNSDKDIVGHLALSLDGVDAKSAESGVAVVDPRYRGHGLFKKMKRYQMNYAKSNNIVGIYSEAVTVHPFSQKGGIELGACEVGFLLGYSPGDVSFQDISDKEKPRRQSVAILYTPINEYNFSNLFIPTTYEELIGGICNKINFNGEVIVSDSYDLSNINSDGQINLFVRPDHNQAFLIVDEYGQNTIDQIHYNLKQLCLHRIDCIYIDLPLNNPATGYFANRFRELGFFYGAFIPQLRIGDTLRLQYLNNVEILRDDIKVASDFGENLLDNIFEVMPN